MTNPQDSTPTPALTVGPITTVTNVGISLIRLGANVLTRTLTAVSALSTDLAGIVDKMAPQSGATLASQGRTDLAGAAGDLLGATARLYFGLLKATVEGLEAAARAVDTAVAEPTTPVRK